jgi:membrane dipeptidase
MSHSRRSFLRTTALAGAAAAVSPLPAFANRTTARGLQADEIDDLFARAIVVDDLSGFDPNPSLPDHGFSLAKESGITIVSPTLGDVVPASSYETSVHELAHQAAEIAQYADRMLLIRTFSDVMAAKKERKVGVLVNFQNSVAIGTELKTLHLFYELGVRQIQLTFNWRNWVGDGCTERTQAGLSYFGVELVEKMNELGILVDVSHSGYQTTLDAIEVSKKPIIFSHTNCKALCDHPRNKTDEQIKALARKGGVMGLSSFNWFVSDKPRSGLEDLLDHYDHVVKLVGPDHLGIGSDFGVAGWAATEPDAEWEAHKSIYGEREWKTIKGRFPPFIAEVNNAARYKTIARGLRKRGYAIADIEKILGSNFVRIYKEVLKP